MSKNVYPIKYLPNHPRTDITGMVKEHILVMGKHLGRTVESTEIVHHVDFNKAHNEIENLFLMTRNQHQNLPLLQFKFLQSKGLVVEWKAWLKEHIDDVDQRADLEMLIVHAENKQERLKARISRRKTKLNTNKGTKNDA